MAVGLLAGLLTGDIVAAGVIAVLAGVVSAAWQYNTARRDSELVFDLIDFGIAVLSAVFVGAMGFLGGTQFIDHGPTLLFVVGISAIAGFNGLLSVKDMLLDMLRHKLVPNDNNKQQERYEERRRNPNIEFEYDEQPPSDDNWMDNNDNR